MSSFTPAEMKRCDLAAWVALVAAVLLWAVAAWARAAGAGIPEYLVCMVGTAGTAVVLATWFRVLVWIRRIAAFGVSRQEIQAHSIFLAAFDLCLLAAIVWMFYEDARHPAIALWPIRKEMTGTLLAMLGIGALPWVVSFAAQGIAAASRPRR
jgi:hypothetical protein